MSGPAAQLAGRLAREAEAVCRHYLPRGRRAGRYWLIGDAAGTPGRSLFVRLHGPGCGRWADAATGQHGDLLDLIGLRCAHAGLSDTLDEARRFLGVPRPEPSLIVSCPERSPGRTEAAARRLFAACVPVCGTLAETYFRWRGIAASLAPGPLAFHPACYHRDEDGTVTQWPALIAAVTDGEGRITGVQRTWLARDGTGKAPLPSPRKMLGSIRGHGVRFGVVEDTLVAGEGLETILSLHSVLGTLPCLAALSAYHLAALELPAGLRHLIIARDGDRAGVRGAARLAERATAAGIAVRVLVPVRSDFNDDLCAFGIDGLRTKLLKQLGGAERLDQRLW